MLVGSVTLRMSTAEMNVDTLVESLTSQADSVFKNFAYEGFNPILIRKKLMERTTYKSDIPVLISLYVQRGTNTTKILKTVSEEGKNLLEALFLKYQIKPSVSSSSGRTVLTLSRIAAAYPDAVVRLINDKPEFFNTPIHTENWKQVPHCMMVPCFASTIPKKMGWITDAFLERHYDLMCDFDDVINGNNPTPSRQMKTYQDAAFNSKVVTEAQRIDCFLKVGLLQRTEDGKLELTKGEDAVETTSAFTADTGVRDQSTDITMEELQEARLGKRKSRQHQAQSPKKRERRGRSPV